MKVSRSRLATIIADKVDNPKVNATELAQELAAYVLSEGRAGELDSLLRDVMQVRTERGTVEVMAHTAFPLSSSARADIDTEIRTLFPAARKIIISEVRDSDVVAGVRLELANQQLDLSVRSKLNRFKQLTTTGATT